MLAAAAAAAGYLRDRRTPGTRHRSPAPMLEPARRPLVPTAAPSLNRAALSAIFVLSLVAFAAGRAWPAPGLALAGALGTLIFGVGTAPTQLQAHTSLAARLTVAVLTGLSVALLIGGLMVLAPLWHPAVAALLALATAAVFHALAAPSVLRELHSWRADRAAIRTLPQALRSPSLLCSLAGSALWLGSAVASPRIVPGIGGFLPRITPLWYAGVVLVLAAVALARRERHEAFAGIAVVSLAMAFTLTPALIYGMPRSQSAAKHIDLVRFILQAHHLRLAAGIYAAFSAFFSAIAWLCRLAHVSDPTGLATAWPVLMALAGLAEMRLLFGRLVDGPYRRWLAITLVLLVNAIGADYFSPQSVGYVLGLGTVAVAVSGETELSSSVAIAVLVAASCALAITHELSPYIIGVVLIVLGALRCARPRWAGLPMLAAAVIWALANYHSLSGYLSLANLGSISNFAPPPTPPAPGLTRDPIVAAGSYSLLLGLLVLIALALIGFSRHRRERVAWAALISAGVGLMFVAVNPYGNEGIFRASLFGIPWLAVLAVRAVRAPGRRLGQVAWMGLSVALLGTFLVASFGMDATNVLRASDQRAVRFFTQRAPPGSFLLSLGFGDLPSPPPNVGPDLAIAYAQVNNRATQRRGRPVPADLVRLLARYEYETADPAALRQGRLYVLWSPVLVDYAEEYALDRPAQMIRWRRLLLTSPSWTVAYEQAGTYLFKAVLRPGSSR